MKLKLFFSTLLLAIGLSAEEFYQKPEDFISKLVGADSFSSVILNYQHTALIKRYGVYSPSMDFIARPQLRLAQLRFNPENYKSTVTSYIGRIAYYDMLKKTEREIKFSEGAVLSNIIWSEDGKHLLVGVDTKSCYEAWVVSIPGLAKKKIPGVCINDVMGNKFWWIDKDRVILSARTPEQKKGIEQKKLLPVGPVVQESMGKRSENRTYPDLLKNESDEKILEAAMRSQIKVYNIGSGALSNLGAADTFSDFTVSPDQKKILIERVIKPYSKVVPIFYFGIQYDIWDLAGRKTHALFSSGPHESVPIEGVILGPRSLRWLPDEDSTLLYAQALDGGNWKNKVEFRDELFKLKLLPGGKTETVSFYKVKKRFDSISALDRGLGYMVNDYERDTKWFTITWLKTEGDKVVSDKTIFSLSEDDDYNSPGSAYRTFNKFKQSVLAVDTDNQSVFLSGKGASPEGNRPFLNRYNLQTGEKKQLFQSPPAAYETFVSFIDDKKFSTFLTNFETPTVSPRYMLHKTGVEGSELLYADKNPYEVITRLKKEVLKYKRKDGVELSGVLYYPLDYVPGKKYPMVLDAYPLEYTDASTAGQVRGSAYTFETPFRADVMYFALRGYVVLQDAQIPIIGSAETKNDDFLPQLVAGADAAIRAVDAKGLIDNKKVGVIGHSYGAFMVANLLTHTDLFAAGIARSGAYNRTLTPFGFQGEYRTFWQAKDTYMKVSPFYTAEKMKKPLLLIHGQADTNPGTFTLQSERYFEALKGQGATVRLVLLPEEPHSYAARETIEHVLYEEFKWFDNYLE